MADAFPLGEAVFDSACKTAVKIMLKTWIKQAKIKNVNACFNIDDAFEIASENKKITATSRGYMLGYNDLKSDSINSFFRFLANVGDKCMKMQIIKYDFLK